MKPFQKGCQRNQRKRKAMMLGTAALTAALTATLHEQSSEVKTTIVNSRVGTPSDPPSHSAAWHSLSSADH